MPDRRSGGSSAFAKASADRRSFSGGWLDPPERKGQKGLPRLYAIIDVDVCQRAGWLPRDLAREYLNGGARLLQLRAKALPGGAFLDLAAGMIEDARAAGAMVIVNDRADVAVLAGAAGVHVGQDDLSPQDVRRVAGADAIVGFSTHSETQIDQALQSPISYLAIGPVFSTSTKDTGYAAVGYAAVERAAERARASGVAVVAIGGITLATAPRVIEAGAAAVAVIGDLVVADPQARVRQYLAALS